MLAKEVTKWATVAAGIATAFSVPQVETLVSQMVQDWDDRNFIALVVAGVAAFKFISGQIGLGRGDDPSSPSLKGVMKDSGNGGSGSTTVVLKASEGDANFQFVDPTNDQV